MPGTTAADFVAVGDDLYVTSYTDHEVFKVSADGAVALFSGTGVAGDEDGEVGVATFDSPNGIAASPDGARLYVQQLNHRLRVIELVAG